MPTSVSNPASPFADGGRNYVAQFGPAAGSQGLSLHADFAEGRIREVQHDPLHAGIADQDVRAAAQQPQRNIFLAAAADERRQLVDVAGLGEIFGRPAQVKPGVRGQRLAGA